MSRMHACPGGRDSWSRAGNERSSIVRRFADLPIGRSFVTSCCRRLTLNLAHVLQTPIHNVPQILRCKSKRLPVDAEAIHAHLYVLDAYIGLVHLVHPCGSQGELARE